MEYINPRPNAIRPLMRAGKQQQQTNNSRRKRRNQRGQPLGMVRHFGGLSPVIRVITGVGTISSNGSGAIPVSSISQATVSAQPGWSASAADYQFYRVRQVKMRIFPATVNATSTTGPYQSVMVLGRFWGNTVPTSANSILDSKDNKAVSTLQEAAFENNFLGFNQAQLVLGTGSTYAGSAQYGICWASPVVANLPINSIIFSYIFEYVVEFSGAI